MPEITRVVIAPYTTKQMFTLVNDIENYQNYLPWCSSSTILSHKENTLISRIDISYAKIKTHFTTANTFVQNQQIEMQLVDGPFKLLTGHWLFSELGENGCKIEFNLKYSFSNFLVEKVIGAVFERLIKNIVDSFIKKAHEIYMVKL